MKNFSLNSYTSQISFKGYDARAIRGFLTMSNFKNLGNELSEICKKEGVDVFFTTGASPILKNEVLPVSNKFEGNWAQDVYTFLKNEFLVCDFTLGPEVQKFFKLPQSKFQQSLGRNFNFYNINKILDNLVCARPVGQGKFEVKTLTGENLVLTNEALNSKLLAMLKKRQAITHSLHVQGGNSYIAQNKYGNEFILLGEDEFTRFDKQKLENLYADKNMAFIPQMDFHLDMFMRPLNNGHILIADDKLTLNVIQNMKDRILATIKDPNSLENSKELHFIFDYLSALYEKFQKNIKSNIYENIDKVENKLKSIGFEPIRVPGRFYSVEKDGNLLHSMNFLNANAFLNKNKDIVYITNSFNIKELIDIPQRLIEKFKLSFEEEFYKFIAPYVKKEHTYFIKGDKNAISEVLYGYGGGIHCLCAEIPKT